MIVNVKKIYPDAIVPQHMREGDAAIDLCSYHDVAIKPWQRLTVGTGVAFALPEGYWGNVRSRSGLSSKHGIEAISGVLDSNYRGELHIILINLSDEEYQIKKGDRIAQMIVMPHAQVETNEVAELSDTNRGDSGFNSTGY